MERKGPSKLLRCSAAEQKLSIRRDVPNAGPSLKDSDARRLEAGRSRRAPRIAQSRAEAGIDEAVVADSCDARNIDSASPIQLDAERRVSQVVDEVRRLAAQPAEAA
jgi:hypothetical protein